MRNCNYELKPGQLIYVKGQPYGNKNLTDEIAAAYIKEDDRRKVMFSVIPEGKAQAPKAKPTPKKEAKNPKPSTKS